MGRTLLAWELGGGLGHLINLLPLAKGLSQRGHRLYAAMQDVAKAERVFRGLELAYLQAPTGAFNPTRALEPQRSFVHILHNHGFSDPNQLRAMASAWRNLFELVCPDLIVFDHSPTALLAASGLPARKALIGTGFFCPLDESPMADLRPWLPNAADKLRQDEDRVMSNVNTVLASWRQPPLERLSRLFYDVDEHFLATLPGLDHYPARTARVAQGARIQARYWGVWPNIGGQPPRGRKEAARRSLPTSSPFPPPATPATAL